MKRRNDIFPLCHNPFILQTRNCVPHQNPRNFHWKSNLSRGERGCYFNGRYISSTWRCQGKTNKGIGAIIHVGYSISEAYVHGDKVLFFCCWFDQIVIECYLFHVWSCCQDYFEYGNSCNTNIRRYVVLKPLCWLSVFSLCVFVE